jgi:putative membrane protein
MNAVAQVLAVVEALLLLGVGSVEAFLSRERRFQRMFRMRPGQEAAVRPWAINVGFYNIVFGVAFLVGAALSTGTDPLAGRTLIVVLAAAQVVLGIVLFVTERRLWRAALVQTLLPLALIAATLL